MLQGHFIFFLSMLQSHFHFELDNIDIKIKSNELHIRLNRLISSMSILGNKQREHERPFHARISEDNLFSMDNMVRHIITGHMVLSYIHLTFIVYYTL